MRVVVVGLDGATWTLINPWIRDGSLKNLKKLIEVGVSSKLLSTIPPITFPSWKCYSTGKNPGKLGVFSFEYFDRTNKEVRFHNALSFRAYDLWDYLSWFGYKCLVINMPGTYPPKRINGIMISGFPAEDKNYTYPKYIEEILKKRYNYTIHPKQKGSKNAIKRQIKIIMKMIESRFDIAKEYLREFNFINITIFYIDVLQHFFWNDDVAKKGWMLIDKKIGELIDLLDPNEDYLFIISDHGFSKLFKSFYINNWLINNNYLYLRSYRRNFLSSILYKLYAMLDIIGISKLIKILPKKFRDILNKNISYGFLSDIDWQKTKAFYIGTGAGGIYINKEMITDPNKQIELINELKTRLQNIIDPINKKRVVDVYIPYEIYRGSYADLAPDLIVVPKEGYEVVPTISQNGRVWGKSPTGRIAFHDMNGIFLAVGPKIKKRYENIKNNIKIYDIAPTILHIFGLPIPNDMDGRVLTEIFEPDSELAKRKPIYVDPSYYEKLYEKERLRAKIKYLKLKKKNLD